MVVRRSLLDRYPWIAVNIVQAFEAAKAEAEATVRDVLDGFVRTGGAPVSLPDALRVDPMPYGVQAAAPVLEQIADWVFEQGLSSRRVSLAEVFAPSTMSL